MKKYTLFVAVILAVIVCSAVTACSSHKSNVKDYGLDYLVLVNKQNKLPGDWESKVHLVTTTDIDGDKIQVEEQAFDMYEQLRLELLNLGVDIELDSCYRSVAEQQDIWDRFTVKYGEDYVKTHVAVPGYSEHHTGLALDICIIKDGVVIDDNDMMMEENEIFEIIHSHLADYGFILRYMPGKEDITGYSYEPWHLRYVGSPDIATEITLSGCTLEEYLEK